MKASKKFLAVLMSIFMIASMWHDMVWASTDKSDVTEEIWDVVDAPPVPDLKEEIGLESMVTITEASEEQVEAVIPEDSSELSTDRVTEVADEEIEEEVSEEIIGAGVQVGDGVMATFNSNTGAVVFESNGGTLWSDWRSKAGFQNNKIKSISSTGTMYLPANSRSLFQNLVNLTYLGTYYFNTTKVTKMQYMFYDCNNLKNLDLSNFDTSNVTDMSHMFWNCQDLTNLDLSGFNTSNVTDMSDMFSNCNSLTNLDLSGFNTSNVTDMDSMFNYCSSLTNLNLGSFNTSNVTSMVSMFSNCSSLTKLNLSSFNTSNVKSMRVMFYACSSLTNLDLRNFNTSNVTYMDSMFGLCSSLTNLDLCSFNTSNVAYMYGMFFNCNSLKKLDMSSFDTSVVSDIDYLLEGCTNLEILRTPKQNSISDIELPLTMYDITGKTYTKLPVLMKSIVLGKTQQIAHEYAGKAISECTITLKPNSYTYDGTSKKPAVTVKNGSKVLTSGMDYNVSYSQNKNAGMAVVTITATETGDYEGAATVNFTIKKADAGLAFAESNIKKKLTDAAFTNALTKVTSVAATFTCDNIAVAAVDRTSGEVTIKGAGTATITAQAKAGTNYNSGSAMYTLIVKAPPTPTPTLKPSVSGFSDVQDPNHAYYNAIYWAAEAGITKGYPDGTFGIDRDCTRGEMMMFLWRYAGKQEPKAVSKSPFKDVPKTHTFYKAILWGSQKGITKGYSDGTFGIDRNVSRGECMMFLWRLKGKPAPKAVAKAPFPDVPKSHVFYNAVLWGYQKKITTGFTSGKLKGKFGVNENCSRGQIVTFLYRAK